MADRRQLKSEPLDANYGGITNDVEVGQFEAGLKINKHDLDSELSKQPESFNDVADRYALAVSKRDQAELEKDQAKDALKVEEARISLEIRNERAAKGEKITETLLEQLTLTDLFRKRAMNLYVAKTERYIKATELANKLEGLKWAYSGRAPMLEGLCKLWAAGYFQTASVNGPGASDVKNSAYEENKAKLAAGRQNRSSR